MRIVLGCSARRGLLCLRKLRELRPADELVVVSFPEEPWEPPFLADLRAAAAAASASFHEGRRLEAVAALWEREVDLVLLVGWRYLVPEEACRRPRRGVYVLHDALLPAYRGFSPTVWAILNGEPETGATLFRIAREVDAGDVVDQERVPIGEDETITTVIERVTDAYLLLLERNVARLCAGDVPARPQDAARATFACKRLPEDNELDWTLPSRRVHALVRAVTRPYPGAFTWLDGRKLTVWAAARLPERWRTYVGRVPGRVVEVRPGAGTVVLTGDGALLLEWVQLEGEPIVCAADVLTSPSTTLRRGAGR